MDNNHPKLELRLGEFFSAIAVGRFAICSLVLVVFGYFGGLAVGLW